MSQPTIPEVDLKSLKRSIAESTYSVYCSRWRYAEQQFKLTGVAYWKEQMDKWELKITRSGRVLPKPKELKPVTVKAETEQPEFEPYPGYKITLGFLEEAVRIGQPKFAAKFRQEIMLRGGPIPEHLRADPLPTEADEALDAFKRSVEEVDNAQGETK